MGHPHRSARNRPYQGRYHRNTVHIVIVVHVHVVFDLSVNRTGRAVAPITDNDTRTNEIAIIAHGIAVNVAHLTDSRRGCKTHPTRESLYYGIGVVNTKSKEKIILL
jgi:hypothetical protein